MFKIFLCMFLALFAEAIFLEIVFFSILNLIKFFYDKLHNKKSGSVRSRITKRRPRNDMPI